MMFAGRKSDHMDDRERSERALQIAATVAGPSWAVGRSLSHFRPRRNSGAALRGRERGPMVIVARFSPRRLWIGNTPAAAAADHDDHNEEAGQNQKQQAPPYESAESIVKVGLVCTVANDADVNTFVAVSRSDDLHLLRSSILFLPNRNAVTPFGSVASGNHDMGGDARLLGLPRLDPRFYGRCSRQYAPRRDCQHEEQQSE